MVKFWLRARRAIVMPNLKPPVITLEKQRWIVPEERRFGKETGVPLRAGGTSAWRLVK